MLYGERLRHVLKETVRLFVVQLALLLPVIAQATLIFIIVDNQEAVRNSVTAILLLLLLMLVIARFHYSNFND